MKRKEKKKKKKKGWQENDAFLLVYCGIDNYAVKYATEDDYDTVDCFMSTIVQYSFSRQFCSTL